ncbi:MAG TPA: cyclopropane-fatty-acyl-phospholipid synthase family protein [Methylibium sp.]|uniref:cyclopropane-fatty-acyl-phospholipid synthase family protein n=1 Tax=Methylibium sp. TaxID=2067992 RepID=UPI002DBF7A70|nr:cyclopropane-fatty-acyl-phospholipid synthase family protein [Methylibium sp.]HEU4460419.1 cyclopropane-fatty-acyl-phospholipid synthase family protein [Methylibium sp.]
MNSRTQSSLASGLASAFHPALLPAGAPPAARAVFKLMAKLRHGQLDVQLPDGSTNRFGQLGGDADVRAAIGLRNWKVCAAALKRGDIGFAETYLDGDWSTPDLAALLRLFIANRDEVESVVYGTWWGSLLHRARHMLNRNSRRGSKKNIHAHYDLGNDFYRLWLDSTMSYSSAWFEGDRSRPIEAAQQAKLRRALAEAGVREGARVLEIGCGWGSLAEIAARDFGARVTGLTLSSEQLAYAQQRLEDAGLADRAQLRFQDYRDIADAPFDAIVSIEMFEAVGREYWAGYFRTLHAKLKPGGRACIQSITIRDDLFERYLRSTDFIQQYIFPGGCLPSASAFEAEAAKAGLVVERRFAFGADYAETLRRWRERFLAEEAGARKLGFDARFMRIWEFYLAYCEAAFDTGNTDVVQFTLLRP